MTCSEIIIKLFLGKRSLNFIPLETTDLNQRSASEAFKVPAFFYFQRTAKFKNYIPSKKEVDNSLQDSIVKDKQSWQEDIAYMEMLKNSKKHNALKNLHDKNYTSIAVKAVIILVVIFLTTAMIVFHLKNKNNEELYNQFYTPLHTSMVIPMASNLTDPSMDEAFEEYSNKNYSLALKLFNRVTADSHGYYIAQLYAGICDMEMNQIDAALIHFNKAEQPSSLRPQVNWYKGLCHIKRGTPKEAIQIFTEIKKSNNAYSAKAEKILNRL